MRALVTGGGGFLGGAIVRQLRDRGDTVRSFSRHHYDELENLGVEQRRGDLADAAAVADAVEGCDLVFHVAAKAGVWGPADEYFRANVVGTRNVLAACRRHGVRRLVFTSSPSVIGSGRDIHGDNESLPYPGEYTAEYPRTKAIAEAEVLRSNCPELATVALRPHLIWGPGDPHLLPRLIVRAKAGRLRQVGDGQNTVDITYVDNAAAAHLLAADRLVAGSPIAGRAYFISQGEPVPLWPFINQVLELAGVPPATRRMPAGLAYTAGTMFEALYKLFRIRSEPPMTRFLAQQLSTSHWFDISAARRNLGYVPVISTDEGLRRLATWLSGPGARKSAIVRGSP
ncbi:MAG TPA: NAD-dependent epimerase/dehydratase family protein [Gemmataceae bacterium]|nr:NAD-dependent epimerase/dehydratase family protein [Gemmataceae bacterium]